MKLKGNVAIVTGGARGIGKRVCECFLEEGAMVIIFDLNKELGEQTLAELGPKYGKDRVNFYRVDITNEDEVKQMVRKVMEDKKKIDVLVNNAGITMDNLMIRMSLSEWEKVINVNLTGAFICSKYVVKEMIKKRAGKIISISSIVGVHGNAGQCNYSASKAGIIGLTKSLAKEVASRNIMVNAVAPGYIQTEMTERLGDKIKEKLVSLIPTGRLGTPEDVAKSVLFLASSDSDYITGTVLNVDGGMGI